jgi:hypothetical protein
MAGRGACYPLYVGSPQLEEGDDRKEEILIAIHRAIDARKSTDIIAELDSK